MSRINWEWAIEEEKVLDEGIVKKIEAFLNSIHLSRPIFDEDYEQMEADRNIKKQKYRRISSKLGSKYNLFILL
ncbi:MAG: hypothetical protein ACRCZW_07415 [Lactobacillaceae bacterium]